MKVLIVDDQKEIIFLYKQIMEAFFPDFEVFTAKDGLKAVNFILSNNKTIDLILMDYSMPYLDGISAMKKILEYNPKIKIIIHTGDNFIEKRAIKEGAYLFLSKPLNINRFREIIENISMSLILNNNS